MRERMSPLFPGEVRGVLREEVDGSLKFYRCEVQP
jgi:hypothetical protein